jgi:hypothetical protein
VLASIQPKAAGQRVRPAPEPGPDASAKGLLETNLCVLLLCALAVYQSQQDHAQGQSRMVVHPIGSNPPISSAVVEDCDGSSQSSGLRLSWPPSDEIRSTADLEMVPDPPEGELIAEVDPEPEPLMDGNTERESFMDVVLNPETASWRDTPVPMTPLPGRRQRKLPWLQPPRQASPGISTVRADRPGVPPPQERRPWSIAEERRLRQLYSIYGPQWRLIQTRDQDHEDGPLLQGRTNVNLKDKIRNIKSDWLRYGESHSREKAILIRF